MFFQWLKRYMPRSLYGRAALILLLPIVTLQLAVSVAFIQRHFDTVTRQLTGAVAIDLRYLLDELNKAEDADAAQEVVDRLGTALRLAARVVPEAEMPAANLSRWYDLTAGRVISALEAQLPEMRATHLPDDRTALVWLDTSQGLIEVQFRRTRVSAPNPHQLLVIIVVLGTVMTLVSYIFLRNQLRPIRRLGIAAEAFGKGRHVPYRPSGAIEVRAAGNAFLDMRARIERQIEQRTLMLSGVSHDLRTPLTRMRLSLSMMEDDPEAEALLRDVRDMEGLLDAFLDFARGEGEGEFEATDPIALARQAVEDSQRAGRAATLVQTEGRGTMMLRPLALRRALDNLIGNAVRYGTRAEVSVAFSDRSLRISVEDDGPGIAPEDRDAALRPFQRLDSARNQNKGAGVGLGLAIAQDVARAHGGILRLGESHRLGGLRADIVIGR